MKGKEFPTKPQAVRNVTWLTLKFSQDFQVKSSDQESETIFVEKEKPIATNVNKWRTKYVMRCLGLKRSIVTIPITEIFDDAHL